MCCAVARINFYPPNVFEAYVSIVSSYRACQLFGWELVSVLTPNLTSTSTSGLGPQNFVDYYYVHAYYRVLVVLIFT